MMSQSDFSKNAGRRGGADVATRHYRAAVLSKAGNGRCPLPAANRHCPKCQGAASRRWLAIAKRSSCRCCYVLSLLMFSAKQRVYPGRTNVPASQNINLFGRSNPLFLTLKEVRRVRPAIQSPRSPSATSIGSAPGCAKRFGIYQMVERYTLHVAKHMPSLAAKRVSPHSIRHTTGTHLLRAGVDINTIRAWLGHVSLTTTNIYAEVDLEMKAKAVAHCEIKEPKRTRHWRDDPGLISFLRSL